jgi:hypothetical protein
MFEVLIIGGSFRNVMCSSIGLCKKNLQLKTTEFSLIKKSSSLQEAIFNNAYDSLTLGSDLLSQSTQQLSQLYPHVTQIPDEKS